MSYVVTMVRDAAEIGGRDHFSCGLDAWELLLELGNTFGWKPLGTLYVPSDHATMPDNPTRHDYLPGDHQDGKLVEAVDALGWANALSEARVSPHLTAMIGDRIMVTTLTTDTPRSDDVPFVTIMDEFISYAFGGTFLFWKVR